MSPRAVLLIAPLLAVLAACETTGDSRQGGLFGWSEAKALDRQAERRAEVTAAEAALRREEQRTAGLTTRERTASRNLAAARTREEDARSKAAASVRVHEASVRAKANLLEEESPTAATVSRARVLRREVEVTVARRAWSAEARASRLDELEREIEEARANLRR